MSNQEPVKNPTAVAGSAMGVATASEITRGSVIYGYEKDQGLEALGHKILTAVENSYTDMSDPHRSTKYQADPLVALVANGSLSISPGLGRLVFGDDLDRESAGALRLDQSASTFTSTATSTTVGSTKIDTRDGNQLNPAGVSIPSTPFSPARTWIKKLFPILADERLYQVALLEVIQVALVTMLKGTKTEQNRKETAVDLGTIIIDNQDIEDRILRDARS